MTDRLFADCCYGTDHQHYVSDQCPFADAFSDTFDGDDAHLLRCAAALLSLDASGSLVPHGIGGHARGIINALGARLAMHKASPQSTEAVERARGAFMEGFYSAENSSSSAEFAWENSEARQAWSGDGS